MNTQLSKTDKTKTQTPPAVTKPAAPRPFRAQAGGLSREETRRIVLEMIG